MSEQTTFEAKTTGVYLALISLIFALAIAVLLLSTLVALTVSDHWKMRMQCESELDRSAHCIVGYFPMEVVEVWGNGERVEKEND